MSLRIGVVGAGRGRGPASVFKDHKDCELVAVTDRNPDLLKALCDRLEVPQRYDEFDDMVEADLDAVFVATPPPLHAEHSVAALRAGKHVQCEVPAVPSIEGGQELVKAVRETGLKYSFAENMCYFPYCHMYRDLVRDGELGEIIYVEAEYIHNCEHLMEGRPDGMGGGVEGKPSWRAKRPPIHYCTHDLGPLLQWLEDRCVTAVGMHTGCRRRTDLGVIDMEVALLRTARNITIKQLCGFAMAKEPAHHWFCVYGTEGQIEQNRFPVEAGCSTHRLYREKYDKLGGPMTLHVPNNDPSAPPEATVGGHGTSEYFMVDEFVQCILNDTKPPIDVYEGLDWTLPGLCAHISAENGSEPVDVPDPREW